MTATADEQDVRRPGRPRDERADRAIISATLELLADDGFHALSVEAVAAKAGCGKTTIYRRWPGKRELVADALGSLNDTLPDLPHGSARERALALMVDICQKDPHSISGRIMPRMMSYRESHPDLFADYVQRVIRPRRERMIRVLREGIENGEVREDIDVELAGLSLSSPLIMLSHSGTRGLPARPEAERLLDLVWRGVGTG